MHGRGNNDAYVMCVRVCVHVCVLVHVRRRECGRGRRLGRVCAFA